MGLIIQTGHHSSNSELLMKMLYQRGLSKPLNSYSRNLSPEETSNSLSKIFHKNNHSLLHTRIIDNLVVDLMLSNLDQQDWGWSDEDNLYSLSYWRDADPSNKFILVFDSPGELFKRIQYSSITTDELKNKIEQWVDYNKKLLAFFEENKDICLLLEGSIAVSNLSHIREKIQSISNGLKLKSDWQIQDNMQYSPADSNPLLNIITDEILKQFPVCINLYKKLQSKASIKVSRESRHSTDNLESLVDDFNILINSEIEKKQQTHEITHLVFLNQELIQQLEAARKHTEKQVSDNKPLNYKIVEEKKIADEAIKQERARLGAVQNEPVQSELQKENALLINQLHQVQEELEKYYLENQRLKSNEAKKLLSDTHATSNQGQVAGQAVYYGAVDRVKQDLPYRLGAQMIKAKTVKDLAGLPLALAREYQTFQKQKPIDNLPPIEAYQDAQEAEKVKKHLSYRLGKTLVNGIINPKSLVSLPKEVAMTLYDFKVKK